MLEDLKKDATQRMQKCVSAFRDQLKKLRTGRAHTSLIEHIKVDYYGSEMPLNQVANIATEDARTLTVSPWEKAMVPVIEKAIYKSDLGLTPNTAGQLIRINMPALTEERRRDIIKVVKSEAENARVAVRGVRREVMNELKEMLKEKLIAQDDDRRAQDDVQKLTDKHVADIEQAIADKEKELMQVGRWPTRRSMSQSSWTATADGPDRAACHGRPGIAPVSRWCARSWRKAPAARSAA